MRRTWRVAGVLAGILSLAAGCATGRVVGDTYRDSAHGFEVRLPPPPWQLRSVDEAAVAFDAPARGAGMALRVDCKTPEEGNLPSVARHLFFGLQGVDIQQRRPLQLHDIPALEMRVRARLGDQPVEVESVTFRRAGCLYDFLYTAPPAAFQEGQSDFEAFVHSWTPIAER